MMKNKTIKAVLTTSILVLTAISTGCSSHQPSKAANANSDDTITIYFARHVKNSWIHWSIG